MLVVYVTRLVVHTMLVIAGTFVTAQFTTFEPGTVIVKHETKLVAGIKFVKQNVAPAVFVTQRTRLVAGNTLVKQKVTCVEGTRFVTQTKRFVAASLFVTQ